MEGEPVITHLVQYASLKPISLFHSPWADLGRRIVQDTGIQNGPVAVMLYGPDRQKVYGVIELSDGKWASYTPSEFTNEHGVWESARMPTYSF